MALIARIIGLSLIMAGFGAVLAFALFRQQYSDSAGVALVLGCVGAVAGAAREIATVRQEQIFH